MSDAAIEKRKPLKELAELAAKFQDASMSESTRLAYRSDWNNFVVFCDFREAAPLPASTDTIRIFLTELADQGKSISTVVRALTSINKAHELAGFESVRNPQILALMKGIKRQKGRPQKQMKGISYLEIIQMVNQCDPTMIGTRDRALLFLGWCSALRRSELVALNIGDLEFSDLGVILTITRSKTDQEGKGYRLAIPRAAKGLCPVKCVEDWIIRLERKEREPDKALFRSIGAKGQTMWHTGVKGRLSARGVSRTVKRYAGLCGFPPEKYASHSLRRGLATEAGARGIPERIIARHTRHLSMDTLRQYIESGNIWTENPLASIYTACSSPVSGLE